MPAVKKSRTARKSFQGGRHFIDELPETELLDPNEYGDMAWRKDYGYRENHYSRPQYENSGYYQQNRNENKENSKAVDDLRYFLDKKSPIKGMENHYAGSPDNRSYKQIPPKRHRSRSPVRNTHHSRSPDSRNKHRNWESPTPRKRSKIECSKEHKCYVKKRNERDKEMHGSSKHSLERPWDHNGRKNLDHRYKRRSSSGDRKKHKSRRRHSRSHSGGTPQKYDKKPERKHRHDDQRSSSVSSGGSNWDFKRMNQRDNSREKKSLVLLKSDLNTKDLSEVSSEELRSVEAEEIDSENDINNETLKSEETVDKSKELNDERISSSLCHKEDKIDSNLLKYEAHRKNVASKSHKHASKITGDNIDFNKLRHKVLNEENSTVCQDKQNEIPLTRSGEKHLELGDLNQKHDGKGTINFEKVNSEKMMTGDKLDLGKRDKVPKSNQEVSKQPNIHSDKRNVEINQENQDFSKNKNEKIQEVNVISSSNGKKNVEESEKSSSYVVGKLNGNEPKLSEMDIDKQRVEKLKNTLKESENQCKNKRTTNMVQMLISYIEKTESSKDSGKASGIESGIDTQKVDAVGDTYANGVVQQQTEIEMDMNTAVSECQGKDQKVGEDIVLKGLVKSDISSQPFLSEIKEKTKNFPPENRLVIKKSKDVLQEQKMVKNAPVGNIEVGSNSPERCITPPSYTTQSSVQNKGYYFDISNFQKNRDQLSQSRTTAHVAHYQNNSIRSEHRNEMRKQTQSVDLNQSQSQTFSVADRKRCFEAHAMKTKTEGKERGERDQNQICTEDPPQRDHLEKTTCKGRQLSVNSSEGKMKGAVKKNWVNQESSEIGSSKKIVKSTEQNSVYKKRHQSGSKSANKDKCQSTSPVNKAKSPSTGSSKQTSNVVKSNINRPTCDLYIPLGKNNEKLPVSKVPTKIHVDEILPAEMPINTDFVKQNEEKAKQSINGDKVNKRSEKENEHLSSKCPLFGKNKLRVSHFHSKPNQKHVNQSVLFPEKEASNLSNYTANGKTQAEKDCSESTVHKKMGISENIFEKFQNDGTHLQAKVEQDKLIERSSTNVSSETEPGEVDNKSKTEKDMVESNKNGVIKEKKFEIAISMNSDAGNKVKKLKKTKPRNTTTKSILERGQKECEMPEYKKCEMQESNLGGKMELKTETKVNANEGQEISEKVAKMDTDKLFKVSYSQQDAVSSSLMGKVETNKSKCETNITSVTEKGIQEQRNKEKDEGNYNDVSKAESLMGKVETNKTSKTSMTAKEIEKQTNQEKDDGNYDDVSKAKTQSKVNVETVELSKSGNKLSEENVSQRDRKPHHREINDDNNLRGLHTTLPKCVPTYKKLFKPGKGKSAHPQELTQSIEPMVEAKQRVSDVSNKVCLLRNGLELREQSNNNTNEMLLSSNANSETADNQDPNVDLDMDVDDDIEPIQMLGSVFTNEDFHMIRDGTDANTKDSEIKSDFEIKNKSQSAVKYRYCDDRVQLNLNVSVDLECKEQETKGKTSDSHIQEMKKVTPRRKFAETLENIGRQLDQPEEMEMAEQKKKKEKTEGRNKRKKTEIPADSESSDDDLAYTSGLELTPRKVAKTQPEECVDNSIAEKWPKTPSEKWIEKAKSAFKELNRKKDGFVQDTPAAAETPGVQKEVSSSSDGIEVASSKSLIVTSTTKTKCVSTKQTASSDCLAKVASFSSTGISTVSTQLHTAASTALTECVSSEQPRTSAKNASSLSAHIQDSCMQTDSVASNAVNKSRHAQLTKPSETLHVTDQCDLHPIPSSRVPTASESNPVPASSMICMSPRDSRLVQLPPVPMFNALTAPLMNVSLPVPSMQSSLETGHNSAPDQNVPFPIQAKSPIEHSTRQHPSRDDVKEEFMALFDTIKSGDSRVDTVMACTMMQLRALRRIDDDIRQRYMTMMTGNAQVIKEKAGRQK